jgi:hypothetical protein
MTVKVKVIADVAVHTGNRTYGLGAVFDYEGDAVDKLIEMGFVEKIGGPAKTDEETAKAEAAKKREKAEKAAVKKGLGTAEEVSKLSDQELQELFKGGE